MRVADLPFISRVRIAACNLVAAGDAGVSIDSRDARLLTDAAAAKAPAEARKERRELARIKTLSLSLSKRRVQITSIHCFRGTEGSSHYATVG